MAGESEQSPIPAEAVNSAETTPAITQTSTAEASATQTPSRAETKSLLQKLIFWRRSPKPVVNDEPILGVTPAIHDPILEQSRPQVTLPSEQAQKDAETVQSAQSLPKAA